MSSVLLYHPGVSVANPQGDGLLNTTFTFGTDRDIGEHDGSGVWQLKVTDSANDATGTVTLNSISFYGHSTASAPVYIYTDEFSTVTDDPNNASRSSLVDASGNATLNAAAITSNSVIDLIAGSPTAHWRGARSPLRRAPSSRPRSAATVTTS